VQKNRIAIFFIILFMALITAPSIIVAIDDSIDVSMVFSTSKEEEKGNEKHLDIDVLFSIEKNNVVNLGFIFIENNFEYYYKKYPKTHLNIISPPPEVNIL
jgi:hypothetical protein